MANTEQILHGVQDHLNAGTPDIEGALSLIKEVFRHGVCSDETLAYHGGTLFLLEQVFRPLLIENRELEAVVHHSGQQISRTGGLNVAELEQLLTELEAGLQEAQDNLIFPEGEPNIDLRLLAKTFKTLGYADFPEAKNGSLLPSWPQIHVYLAKIIESEKLKKEALARENGRKKRYLLDITEGLASTSSRLDRAADSINQLGENLKQADHDLSLDALSDSLLGEIQGIGEKTDQVTENLETIAHTTVELEKLFHQADALLLETEDSDLMDAVSGLPNRYGLMARINQARLQVHEGNEAGFAVIFIGIVDLGRVRKNWGRERFSSLIRWLGGKIQETGSYGLFRITSEGLALFSPNTNGKKAMVLAQALKRTVLDRIIEKEIIPKEFHFGIGVVVFEPGMDEEAVLLAGSERMRRSILDDGKPVL